MSDTQSPRVGSTTGPAPDLLLDARRVEAQHQQLYRIQLELGERIEQLRSGWATPDAAALYRAYEVFDGDIEHIKESLELMHGQLVVAHRSHAAAGAEQ